MASYVSLIPHVLNYFRPIHRALSGSACVTLSPDACHERFWLATASNGAAHSSSLLFFRLRWSQHMCAKRQSSKLNQNFYTHITNSLTTDWFAFVCLLACLRYLLRGNNVHFATPPPQYKQPLVCSGSSRRLWINFFVAITRTVPECFN